jgi:hypothetical protein
MGAANTLPRSSTWPIWIQEPVIDVVLKIGLTTDDSSLETYGIIFGLGQVYDHGHIGPRRHFLVEVVYCENRFG